jgi:hypothetical protein
VNSDLRQGLEKFLAWWLQLKTASQPRNADELRQAFLDELNEKIDQFDSYQDWDEIFTEASAKIE